MREAPQRPLPPPLYSVHDDQGYWVLPLTGRTYTMSIAKPVKDELTKRYAPMSGRLEFDPPFNGCERVPFGSWEISARQVRQGAFKKTGGWVLVVAVKDPRTQAWKKMDFGFQLRHIGPSVRSWVTTINRKLKKLQPAP